MPVYFKQSHLECDYSIYKNTPYIIINPFKSIIIQDNFR